MGTLKITWVLSLCFSITISSATLAFAGASFDDKEWELIRRNPKKKLFETMMFVPKGQTYENAQEFIHYLRISAVPVPPLRLDYFEENRRYTKADLSLKSNGMTAQNFVAKAMSDEMKECPGSEWTVLHSSKDAVILEAILKQCAYGAPDRREILKYFLSDDKFFLINFTVFESSMSGAKDSLWREKKHRWMDFLRLMPNTIGSASCFLQQQLTSETSCPSTTPEQADLYRRTK